MTRDRRLPVLLLLLLLVSGLAACSDDDDPEAADDTTETTADGRGGDDEGGADATVEMKEYAYVVDGEVPLGGTVRIENTGQEFHMIGLARMRGGKTLDDVRAAIESDSEDDDATTFDEAGLPGSFMGPGESVALSVPGFQLGNYAMICFLNVEGEETPHFARGMIGELRVVEGEATPPKPTATYSALKGQPIEGPADLDAGEQVIEFKTNAEGTDLEPGIVRLDEGATLESFAAATKQFDEGPLPKDAASKLPGDIVVSMFDFGEETSVFVTVDLEPGTYVLTAEDSDAENAPDIPVEKITVTVS